ncbi:hypothetical protein [Desulfosporosinus youngiae]|jgi:hypothetical protein|uniref:hypothetical protein n=1 Tax=Desulfosporosinus youngiae TaxID=339862 RepID=UPI0012F47A03|nr:hypothetical protein [Desulfosporosinus youngiae]
MPTRIHEHLPANGRTPYFSITQNTLSQDNFTVKKNLLIENLADAESDSQVALRAAAHAGQEEIPSEINIIHQFNKKDSRAV